MLKPKGGAGDEAVEGSADPALDPLSGADRPASHTTTRRAWVVVYVGESAEVTVNGKLTSSSGTRRVYHGDLKPGLSYPFQVQVKEGALVVSKEFMLRADDTKTLQLDGNQLAIR